MQSFFLSRLHLLHLLREAMLLPIGDLSEVEKRNSSRSPR